MQRAVVPCPACKKDIRSSLAAGLPAGTETKLAAASIKDRLTQALNSLQPMPPAFDHARGLMADAQARPADMAKVLEANPAIAARVLRLAGMSLYGDTESLDSIPQAVSALNMQTLNEFVTLACAAGLLHSGLSGYGLKAWELWRHSLAVAYCARTLAVRRVPGMVEEAFLAGLFHDCGKLILDSFVAERHESFAAYVYDKKQSFVDAERRILGFEHPQVAADVCVKWRIPKRQIVAIALHHTPSRFEHDPLACVLHAADATAMMSGIGSGIDELHYIIDEKAMKFLALEDDEYGMLMTDAARYVQRIMACF
jgi:HD-like signal output (HDOD) protein